MYINDNLNNKIWITFDFDWACDNVLNYTLNIINEMNINTTCFVTNETTMLDEFRKNDNIELGIHPNFNKILNGEEKKSSNDIISDILKIVPEAISCRSHALVQSSNILRDLYSQNIKYDLNTYIPNESNIILKPYKSFTGIKVCPFFFEDDIYLMNVIKDRYKDKINSLLDRDGLKIFNFHPIHVFLNTEKINRYENAKKYNKDFVNLKNYKNDYNEFGIRTFLIELINSAKERGYIFQKVSDIKYEIK